MTDGETPPALIAPASLAVETVEDSAMFIVALFVFGQN
jgi:hypothetical protein